MHAVRSTALDLMRRAAQIDAEGQWLRMVPGAFGMVTGVQLPTLNGLWLHGEADPAELSRLLSDVADAGFPYCVQAVPECVECGMAIAGSRRLERGPDIPLMTCATPPPEIVARGLVIRELTPDVFDLRSNIAAAAFEVPASVMQQATSVISQLPGYRMFLGEVDGVAVTTAVAITSGESVGVFDVATPAEHRGHGYGAAITAHAIRVGFDAGARWAWLQSSPEGFGVYERLGFRTVERWALWVGLS